MGSATTGRVHRHDAVSHDYCDCRVVHVCVCVCVCACVRACVRACVCACVRACVRACVCACVCAYVRACMRTCMHACVCPPAYCGSLTSHTGTLSSVVCLSLRTPYCTRE